MFLWLLYTIVARKDMSQFFLGSCVLSVFVTLLYYEVSRSSSRPREPALVIAVFYLFVFILWCAAGVFFVIMETTNKSKTPAENRDLNKECIFMNFYDSHSIWHFLSSNALFLSALRAIVLSEPCKYCKYERMEDEARERREQKEAKEKAEFRVARESESESVPESSPEDHTLVKISCF